MPAEKYHRDNVPFDIEFRVQAYKIMLLQARTIMFLSFRTEGLDKKCRPRSGSTLFAIPSASFG